MAHCDLGFGPLLPGQRSPNVYSGNNANDLMKCSSRWGCRHFSGFCCFPITKRSILWHVCNSPKV